MLASVQPCFAQIMFLTIGKGLFVAPPEILFESMLPLPGCDPLFLFSLP